MFRHFAGATGIAALIQLIVLAGAIAVGVSIVRRLPPLPRDPAHRGAHRKGRALLVIAGVMAFGWVVNATVLAYWRSQMPN